MKEIRFIHAADLHLDSPMVGLKHFPDRMFKRLQESTFQALEKIITRAIAENVDFVIFAGDIFDIQDRSIRAQSRFRKEMEKLQKKGIPSFVVHGNHDHLSGTWAHLNLPSNVEVFGPEVEMKPFYSNSGTVVHLYGFSYLERHVHDRKIEEYEKVPNADFHIGILHGNLEGSMEHGNYAPFQLKDLYNKEFDYWALGHIHKRSILSEEPPIVYPGNIQGRNKKELGIKGCYLVEMSESGSQLTFVETSDVIWETIEIDATSLATFDDLYRACVQSLDHHREVGKGKLVYLVVNNLTLNSSLSNHTMNELIEALQEMEAEEESFVWPYDISLVEVITWNRSELSANTDFYHELFQVVDSIKDVEDIVHPLYKHSLGRKYLSELTEDDVSSLKKEAEMILLQQLLSDR